MLKDLPIDVRLLGLRAVNHLKDVAEFFDHRLNDGSEEVLNRFEIIVITLEEAHCEGERRPQRT